MLENKDAVYGEGFRQARKSFDKKCGGNLQMLLDRVLQTGRYP